MPTPASTAQDPAAVLAKATIRAGRSLGLTQADVGGVVGLHRSSLSRGLDPADKPGQLGALLVRIHIALHGLVGGDPAAMRHWMATHNIHTGGVPAEQVLTPLGLVRVLDYLDAMRTAA